jgi:hypothetical protein
MKRETVIEVIKALDPSGHYVNADDVFSSFGDSENVAESFITSRYLWSNAEARPLDIEVFICVRDIHDNDTSKRVGGVNIGDEVFSIIEEYPEGFSEKAAEMAKALRELADKIDSLYQQERTE